MERFPAGTTSDYPVCDFSRDDSGGLNRTAGCYGLQCSSSAVEKERDNAVVVSFLD